jgi:hypothetical protein
MLKVVKRFALLNNVVYNIIAHPKNASPNSDRSLPIVDFHDISGGAMWGNKVDSIISWYRPDWHINKSDPKVQMHVQKVKRKRTGGGHGIVDLWVSWATKRIQELPDYYNPCDPQKLINQARAIYTGEGYTQSEITFDDSKMKQISERIYESDEPLNDNDWGDQPIF